MPNTSSSSRPLPALARFCFSCAGTLACWTIWLALAALLIAQLYVALAHRLPVPRLILAKLDSRLAAEGLAVGFERAQFDPTGRLLLEKARLRLQQFEEPLVVADSFFVRKSPWSILSGARAPDEIRLYGATLQLPAPLSPTGTAAPLLHDAAAVLRIEGSLVHLDQLTFRLGQLAIHIEGTYQLTTPADRATPPLAQIISQVLQVGRRIVRDLPLLDALDRPVLHATVAVRPGLGNVAEIELTAAALRAPAGLELTTGPLRATTTLRLDGHEPRPLRVNLHASRATFRDVTEVSDLHVIASTELAPRALALPTAARFSVSAARATFRDQVIRQPIARLDWRAGAPLAVTAAAESHGRVLEARATADLAGRRGDVDLLGVVPPALVDSILDPLVPKVAPYLRFQDPVAVRARASFTPGWRFDRIAGRVSGGRLDSNGVAVTSLRGHVVFDRDFNFTATDARVTAGANHARGSYWMNFRTWDFRYLLAGSMQPMDITGWIRGEWWRNFWRAISFPAEAPDADADVIGNYRNPTKTAYFGRTDVSRATIFGAEFATSHALVFVRPHFAHAFDLQLARADPRQRASGWFKRRADPRTRELLGYDYALAGTLDPDALARLGGPGAAPILAPFTFDQPVTLDLKGRLDYRDGRALPEVAFRGEASGRVTYEGFPLQAVSVEGGVSGDAVRLDRIDLRVADGRGTAKAALSGAGDQRRLGFDFYLEAADLVQAIRAINEYEAARSPGEPPASPNRELLKRASGGRLNFALSAQGRPADLASFNGTGNVEVSGAELGEVHLFGLLSQVLSGLSLNFSSLKLDALHGSYRLGAGQVTFPDIKVTGPNSLIEGRGSYHLLDRTLDFTARFKPYEQNRNLVTGVIGIVMNPLASILELRLTGPIAKPAWSVSLGSSAPREPAPAPAEPPPAPRS